MDKICIKHGESTSVINIRPWIVSKPLQIMLCQYFNYLQFSSLYVFKRYDKSVILSQRYFLLFSNLSYERLLKKIYEMEKNSWVILQPVRTVCALDLYRLINRNDKSCQIQRREERFKNIRNDQLKLHLSRIQMNIHA